MKIGDYKLVDELKNDDSGYAKWGFAKKNKTEYFIKEFLSPVYPPDDSPIAPELIERKRNVCLEFEEKKKELYDKLNECNTGNIVVIEDFFRDGSKYYIVTEKVDSDNFSVEYISKKFSDFQKSVLVKVLTFNVSQLHTHGIVHGDIKPNNVMIKKTKSAYTTKLIDFDSSFLESSPPSFEDIQGDMVYFAPESFLLIANEEGEIDSKIDVFALGLLFHQYYTGNLPYFDTDKYTYAFESVLDDAELEIDSSIPQDIAKQISLMLNKAPENRPTLKEVFSAITHVPTPVTTTVKKEVVEDKKPEIQYNPIKPSSYFKKANNDDLL